MSHRPAADRRRPRRRPDPARDRRGPARRRRCRARAAPWCWRPAAFGQVYSATTNPPVSTGDGVALALRAGAEAADLEFVQFHPTVLWLGPGARGRQPLISEAVRGEGAFLVDAAGQPVHDRPASAGRPGPARRGRQGDHERDDGDRHRSRLPGRPASRRGDVGRTASPRSGPAAWSTASTRSPSRSRWSRPRTTPAAASGPTCAAAPASPGCTPAARPPAPASTAPTGWRRTRCSKAWSSPSASPPTSRQPARRRRSRLPDRPPPALLDPAATDDLQQLMTANAGVLRSGPAWPPPPGPCATWPPAGPTSPS